MTLRRLKTTAGTLAGATIALFTLVGDAQAQLASPSTAEESVIRRGAPEIVLPSSKPPTTRSAPQRVTRFSDATLRGGIGQVPSGVGECVIEEGRFSTTVTYKDGLPQTIRRSDSGVREEVQEFRWNPDRVLLERRSWTMNVLQPAKKRTPERWEAQAWSVETTTWDDYGRPLERNFTQASGQTDSYRCQWLGFRGGHCSLGGPLDATVKLSQNGEVEEVTWETRGRQKQLRGTLEATWRGDLLQTLHITRAMDVESEHYRYDSSDKLTGFRRVKQLPRGERVVTWRLQRDEQGNVTRVERRCEGPCEGMRGTVTFRVRYDETLQNTLCGAWWDDGIEPGLKGW